MVYCSAVRIANPPRSTRQKEMSVFETQPNPNGYVEGFLTQDQRMDDPLTNAPAFDANDLNFDFLGGLDQQQPQGQVPQQQAPADPTQLSTGQDVDWIQSFLESNIGPPQSQAQVQAAATEPAPTPTEMNATWQALVAQLGI